MKVLAFLGFLLGVMAMLTPSPPDPGISSQAQAAALNYAVFRSAVFRYVFVDGHKDDGEIPQSALSLPNAWIALRPWRARIANGVCVIFGSASPDEIEAVRTLYLGSHAIGWAENGKLVPGHGAVTPVPEFVPAGNLVSVMKVN